MKIQKQKVKVKIKIVSSTVIGQVHTMVGGVEYL